MKCHICGSDISQGTHCHYCGAGVSQGIVLNNSPKSFTLFSAYTSMLKKFVDFFGRARRQEFWLAMFANIIVCMIWVFVIVGILDSDNNQYSSAMEVFADLQALVIGLLIYGFIITIPTLALIVRRLHDIGRSGWFVLFLANPVTLIILFSFMFIDSQPGINKYGPCPK